MFKLVLNCAGWVNTLDRSVHKRLAYGHKRRFDEIAYSRHYRPQIAHPSIEFLGTAYFATIGLQFVSAKLDIGALFVGKGARQFVVCVRVNNKAHASAHQFVRNAYLSALREGGKLAR